jgi:hypothetical protein
MNKILLIAALVIQFTSWTQSYAPPAGQAGSTAIHMDSPLFTGWATGIEVSRGFVYIEDTTFTASGSNRASFGDPLNALGKANGNSADVVSLGDSGVAILTFDQPIMNGPGYDFAVFENSFSDDYLEFAFVEVSSDGNRYVRFPNHSEVQNQVQIHGFGLTDTRRIHNLAGKYRAGFGTPFDLEDIKDSTGIDLNAITHVKIIDVIGTIGAKASYDSYGNKINEPYSTPYETGGFDLDGVGVIHQLLGLDEKVPFIASIYPNPSSGIFTVSVSNNEPYKLSIISPDGRTLVKKENLFNNTKIYLDLPNSICFIQIEQSNHIYHHKLIMKN